MRRFPSDTCLLLRYGLVFGSPALLSGQAPEAGFEIHAIATAVSTPATLMALALLKYLPGIERSRDPGRRDPESEMRFAGITLRRMESEIRFVQSTVRHRASSRAACPRGTRQERSVLAPPSSPESRSPPASWIRAI